MGAVASQHTSLTIAYSTVYSGADQRKHQSSARLAFVRGIHRWPVNSLHNGTVTRKMSPFDDVIMKRLVAGTSAEYGWPTPLLKPGLYFSRRLSTAVAYSFVARAGDHGRHRQLSFKCARAFKKYKQSPDRTTKWSIHGIQIQMQIRVRIQISSFWLYLHREITLYVPFEWPHTLSACYRVRLYAWVYIRYWLACAYHLFQSFRRCFSINSTFCGFCNQGGGGIQICNFRCLITTCVLQVCMGRDLINAVVALWLDGKCQRLLATALKVQHCWNLKTTVGDCWRQLPTCAGDSRQLKYKHTHDYRCLSPSRATVGDCRRLKYEPGLTQQDFHQVPGLNQQRPPLSKRSVHAIYLFFFNHTIELFTWW